MVKESLERRAVLPWKPGDLSFSENLQLMPIDEVLSYYIRLMYIYIHVYIYIDIDIDINIYR